nr:MAG TPA: hypothetical protein [Caudoviricetes sp.]
MPILIKLKVRSREVNCLSTLNIYNSYLTI